MAEYYRIGEGLTNTEFASIAKAVRTPDSGAFLSSAWLGYLGEKPASSCKQYMSIYLFQPEISALWPFFNKLELTNLIIVNVEDSSVLGTHELSYRAGDNIHFGLIGTWVEGNSTSEFGNMPFKYKMGIRARYSF
jgi:hypothetical protein